MKTDIAIVFISLKDIGMFDNFVYHSDTIVSLELKT